MTTPLFSLAGRIAMVTGGSRGIGAMIARGFLDAGAERVYITGRDPARCAETADMLGSRCVALAIDIATVDGCRALASLYASHESRLDVLVHNAGIHVDAGGLSEYTEEAWDAVMNVNSKAPFFLTQALLGPLKAAGSRERPAKVINIASIDGIRLNAIEAYPYYNSKSGLIFMTRRLAAELISDNIVMTCIAPGAFPSDMNDVVRTKEAEMASRIPAGRVGRESDMQGATVFLASSAGDWVVGETLILDGGVCLAKYYHPDPIV